MLKLEVIVEVHQLKRQGFKGGAIACNPPFTVKEFKQRVAEADAVLWVTPEYNYSIPGVLKNAIDWLSRVDKVSIGKPSWIIGVSMGNLGSVRAQQHLQDILFSPGVSSPFLPGKILLDG